MHDWQPVLLQAGRLELVTSVQVPRAARKIRATFCPKTHVTDPDYVVMGGEDTSVYIYDIAKPICSAVVINQLQVGYSALILTAPSCLEACNPRNIKCLCHVPSYQIGKV